MGQDDFGLLNYICQKAIIIFDAASVKILLNTLYWVLSAKPARTALILENLRKLWQLSYQKKLGIYSKPTMYFL
jgi:hypothetical protein